jgi:adenylate kinase
VGPPLALTGTPGTGKSSVAAALAPRFRSLEVADLALSVGAGRRTRAGVEVDVGALIRAVRRGAIPAGTDLVVGHLAHLLPIRDVVVLRCHPRELGRRLARRGAPAARRANVGAEALDLVLAEAIRPGRRIREIDTTGRSVAAVARDVARCVRSRRPSAYGRIAWLADPWVTKHLLDRAE